MYELERLENVSFCIIKDFKCQIPEELVQRRQLLDIKSEKGWWAEGVGRVRGGWIRVEVATHIIG
jgi:hypothetical protein